MSNKLTKWALGAAVYTTVESVIAAVLNIFLLLLINQTVSLTGGDGFWYDVNNNFHATEHNDSACGEIASSPSLMCDSVYIYEIIFIALHVLWATSGIGLITQWCTACWTKGWYIFWLVLALACVVMDTFTGAVFLSNYLDNGSEENYLMVLALISFRGGVLYFLNLLAIVFVVISLRNATAQTSETKSKIINSDEWIQQDTKRGSNGTVEQTYVNEDGNDDHKQLNLAKVTYNTHDPAANTGMYGQGRAPDAKPVDGDFNIPSQPRPGIAEQQQYQHSPFMPNDQQHPGYMQNTPRNKVGNTSMMKDNNIGDEFYDDEVYDDFENMPPPKVPARVYRNVSTRTKPVVKPQIPDADYDEQKMPSKSAYDVRPFSYLNPTFRPDHMDVKSMKTHGTDIIETLHQETEQLKKMESESEMSDTGRTPVQRKESNIRVAAHGALLNNQGLASASGLRNRPSFNNKPKPVVNKHNHYESPNDDNSNSDDHGDGDEMNHSSSKRNQVFVTAV